MKAITDFSAEVAADYLEVDEQFVDSCCGVITDDLSDEQIEAGSVVSLIIEAIMEIIEQCNDKERFARHVQNQTWFARAYFRRQMSQLDDGLSFRGRRVRVRELSKAVFENVAGKPETIINSIWDEVKEPAWQEEMEASDA
ncbi:MAG: hypothetical protein ACPGLY_27995 [Rubripirellula sp.]